MNQVFNCVLLMVMVMVVILVLIINSCYLVLIICKGKDLQALSHWLSLSEFYTWPHILQVHLTLA